MIVIHPQSFPWSERIYKSFDDPLIYRMENGGSHISHGKI